MLFDEPAIRDRLSQLVHSLSTDCELCEDLMQEALIHLWQQEVRCPGQTQSWYVQGCHFFLLDYLGQGHSVDSLKRRHNRCPLTDEPANGESILNAINVGEIVEALTCRLDVTEQAILKHFADGLAVNDIGRKLCISHQTVSKHRQHIAAVATRLGISLLPGHARTP